MFEHELFFVQLQKLEKQDSSGVLNRQFQLFQDEFLPQLRTGPTTPQLNAVGRDKSCLDGLRRGLAEVPAEVVGSKRPVSREEEVP